VKRVLILRAQEDAERTAAKVAALGFAPLISPVLEIVPTGASIPEGNFDAALATSAKGVQYAATREGAQEPPLYVVGGRTARVAERIGWRVGIIASDSVELAAQIRARHAKPALFLYLAGRDRRDNLELGLRAAGHSIVVVETYEARAASALSQEALSALAAGDVAVALHYSERSAEIFASLMLRAGLAARLREISHLALSKEAAGPLSRNRGACARVADRPDEERLLSLLACAK
jgi:uroporphyrinogen-III synthase